MSLLNAGVVRGTWSTGCERPDPDSRVTSPSVPRRDRRGSVALGFLAAMAIAAVLEPFTRVTMMHAAWIAAGAMVVTNCCSVERAPQPRHLRAVRDKRILMVYGVGGYRFSDFGANRRAARPAGDGADGRHRAHRFSVLTQLTSLLWAGFVLL